MKYLVMVRYKTNKGVAIRYSSVEASSQTEAQLLATSQIQKTEIIEMDVTESTKNILRKR